MKLHVTARHLTIDDDLRQYAEEKVLRLTRYLDRIHSIEIVWEPQGERFRMQLTMSAVRGQVFITESDADTMHATVDVAVDKMEPQLKRYNERLKSKNRKASGRLKSVHLDEVPSEAEISDEAEETVTYEEILENPPED